MQQDHEDAASLEELQDIRIKVPPDLHAALYALAEAKGVELSTICREVLSEAVLGRIHALKLSARRLKRTGLIGD